jgi:hypothetical protein
MYIDDNVRLASSQVMVVWRRHIFRELLIMGCYMEDYRARVSTFAARTSWATRTTWRNSQGNAQVILCLGTMIPCATNLSALLLIGGTEKNSGLGVEAEIILQILCTGCDRNLKSGTQCNTCRRWFHNGCGDVKARVANSGKWVCDKRTSERLRLLEEKSRMLYFKLTN